MHIMNSKENPLLILIIKIFFFHFYNRIRSIFACQVCQPSAGNVVRSIYIFCLLSIFLRNICLYILALKIRVMGLLRYLVYSYCLSGLNK